MEEFRLCGGNWVYCDGKCDRCDRCNLTYSNTIQEIKEKETYNGLFRK